MLPGEPADWVVLAVSIVVTALGATELGTILLHDVITRGFSTVPSLISKCIGAKKISLAPVVGVPLLLDTSSICMDRKSSSGVTG